MVGQAVPRNEWTMTNRVKNLLNQAAEWYESAEHDLCKGVFAMAWKAKSGTPKLVEVNPWKRHEDENFPEVVRATPLGLLFYLTKDLELVKESLACLAGVVESGQDVYGGAKAEIWADAPEVTKEDVIKALRCAAESLPQLPDTA